MSIVSGSVAKKFNRKTAENKFFQNVQNFLDTLIHGL